MTTDSGSATTAATTMGTAQIGVVDLAVMGANLARNFAGHGYTVALYNRSPARTCRHGANRSQAARTSSRGQGPDDGVDTGPRSCQSVHLLRVRRGRLLA
jgi:3-hydroxyacyl-CoA dehydrogenase